MRFRAPATLIGCGFLMTVIQLVGALAHPAVTFCAAVTIGLLTFVLFQVFQIEWDLWWAPVLLATAASTVGILIRALNPETASWSLVFAPLVTFGTAGTVVLVRRRTSKRCGLCNRRLGSDVALECPRCGLLVCDRGCWDFDHCRCRLCEQNKVPIFSPDGRWWDRQLGPRVTFGRCQLCMTAAPEVDLRACAKCGRPQCRPCWDSANGQCSRCSWFIADLPSQLRIYMLPQSGPQNAADERSEATRSRR